MKCVGCGREVNLDKRGLFSYTCPCGSRVFYDEKRDVFYYPVSLHVAEIEKRGLPHIDYFLGYSNHQSDRKKLFYYLLRSKGSIWSWECPRCRKKFLERVKREKEMGLYPFELHPDLEKALKSMESDFPPCDDCGEIKKTLVAVYLEEEGDAKLLCLDCLKKRRKFHILRKLELDQMLKEKEVGG